MKPRLRVVVVEDGERREAELEVPLYRQDHAEITLVASTDMVLVETTLMCEGARLSHCSVMVNGERLERGDEHRAARDETTGLGGLFLRKGDLYEQCWNIEPLGTVH